MGKTSAAPREQPDETRRASDPTDPTYQSTPSVLEGSPGQFPRLPFLADTLAHTHTLAHTQQVLIPFD